MLDIGCGAGLFLGLVGCSRPNVTAIGFDSDALAIDAASGMALEHFPDGLIRFEHRSVGDPWPEGLFDVVSMIDVLHHIPPASQREAIAEAFAHVAPGGLLIYKDMADRPFFRAWWNRLHDVIIARQWIHYRSIDGVEAWLRGMGAEIVARSSRILGPYGHDLMVAKKPA
jgi:2-polyprenyl-3-methyl-5-hydroxy-6-metoxy-1,4-benzoquinol methylase